MSFRLKPLFIHCKPCDFLTSIKPLYEIIIMDLQIFRKEQEIEALKKKMATTALSESEMKIIQKGLNELEKEANHAKEKMKEVIKEEQEMPLNVDTISKVNLPYIFPQ